MNEILRLCCAEEWHFLRFAILIGILVSPALGIIGTSVVTKRISSLAGASAHAALGGFGLAMFLQRVCGLAFFTATLGAVCGALSAALIVGIVTITNKEREDTVIGAVWAIGMSIGLLFLDRTPGYVDWQGYLFGNILLLSPNDLYQVLALDAAVLIPTVLFFPVLLSIFFDPVWAELRGLKGNAIYLLLLLLTALTIVVLINLAGIMLVIALLTLPAAAAGCWTKHLKSMMLLSILFNAAILTLGLLFSALWELPSGPVIVVLAGILYGVGLCRKYGCKKINRSTGKQA